MVSAIAKVSTVAIGTGLRRCPADFEPFSAIRRVKARRRVRPPAFNGGLIIPAWRPGGLPESQTAMGAGAR